jgi:hypothetical protein
MNDQELKSLWKSQPVAPGEFSLQQLQRDSSSFRNTIVRRNAWEYAACVVVIAVFSYFAWTLPDNVILRSGCALQVLGALIIMRQLHRHASIDALPAEHLALPYAAYLRHQLVRQRDALRTVWRWYIGPTVPGTTVFIWGLAQPDPAGFPWVIAWMLIVPMLVVIAMNLRAAGQLQQKIDELDRAEL